MTAVAGRSAAPQPDPAPDTIRSIVGAHVRQRGGLLPALHALHDAFGWIPPAAIAILADAFNLSRAEVHGVVSFYADFRVEPPRAPQIRICRGEACQARGARAVRARADAIVAAGTAVEVADVFCLGNCALGPSVLVADRVVGRVDVAAIAALLLDATATSRPAGGSPTPASLSAPPAASVGAARSTRVAVPADTAARSVGADEVAAALGDLGCTVVRTGSRGAFGLEPLVEVDTPNGRVGFGPVTPADVAELVGSGAFDGAPHPLGLGPVDAIAEIAGQTRVTFARVGIVDPRSPADHEAHGGLVGLRRALAMTPAEVVAEIAASGLRGRGGAAFPAGIKWQTVLDAPGTEKHVCCNADEGDSGTFADRMLLEGDPFTLIEGMVIAGYAVGAHDGWIYLRSEYPAAIATVEAAIAAARATGRLGPDVCGLGFAFDIHLRVGAGAYICGEETAMLESLEGRRGVVRAKPPLPAVEGLFGCPTLVNNVLTLASVPAILAAGAAAYAALGVGRSRGTQVFQLGGNVARGGIVEVPFGATIRDLVEGHGGGTASGRPLRAVQIGGPLGAYLPVEQLDLALDYETLAAAGALLGHGGIVVFDDTVDLAEQARFAMEFCAIESCGKCTPCRIGSTRGVELIDRIRAGVDRAGDLQLLDDLCEVMADASLCAMGGLTPLPVRSAITHFAADFAPGATADGNGVR